MIDTMTGNDTHIAEWAELVDEEVPESVRHREGPLRRRAEQHAE
jgi:hypothetical protein